MLSHIWRTQLFLFSYPNLQDIDNHSIDAHYVLCLPYVKYHGRAFLISLGLPGILQNADKKGVGLVNRP